MRADGADVDSGAKRNGLSEADFNVLSDLGEERLEGRLEPQTFPWGQVGGDDDVLDLLVGEAVDVEVSRQPAAQPAIGVFDSAFLPGRIRVACMDAPVRASCFLTAWSRDRTRS